MKNIIEATIRIEPATDFQKDFALKAITATFEAMKIHFKSSHKKNDVAFSISLNNPQAK